MSTKLNFILILIVLLLLGGCINMTSENAESKIQSLLEKTVSRNRDLHHGLLLVHSERLNIHWKFAAGYTGKEQKAITQDHTFHIASIGKTFTSALIAKLYEEGKISYDDPIEKYLPDDVLNGLYEFEGNSY